MAWALVMAHRQWVGRGDLSERYLDHARRQIDRIWQFQVDHESVPFLFMPGDEWRPDVFNPSYFAPKISIGSSEKISGNGGGWRAVVVRGYDTVAKSLNATSANADNGLVPAWCDAWGRPVEAFPGAETNYQTDSARLPDVRLAVEFRLLSRPTRERIPS